MEQGSVNGGVVNMTRAMEALYPLLNSARRRVIQVEALVTATTTLLFLQLVLGYCNRRWHNSMVKGVLSLSNAAMFPLILYTLGQMQSSPIKMSLYPVLAVSLVIAAGGIDVVKPCDFHDNKKVLQYVFAVARYAFYSLMVLTLLFPTTFNFKQNWSKSLDLETYRRSHPFFMESREPSSLVLICLCSVYLTSKIFEVQVGTKLKDHLSGKSIEKWMKKRVEANDNHMGHNYLVRTSDIVTVGKIWHFCSNSDNGRALKDVCLSFALFELLKRRYYGFVCAEAGLPEITDFFFKFLLPTENDYERAFRIIEMELGFCYDFFFTKYYSITVLILGPAVLGSLLLLLARISLICAVGVYTLKSSWTLQVLDPIIEVHNTRADYIIALVVLGTVLTVELLQVAFYLASDWFKVPLACWYVTLKPPRDGPIAFIFEKVITSFLRRITMSVGWKI